VQLQGCTTEPTTEKPRPLIGEIFRRHGEAFRELHVLTPNQRKVLRAIQLCRTEALGGHLHVCHDCGYTVPMYNSCLNRHCPTCQSLSQAKWIAERKDRILPVPHFHVVFTLPDGLRALALRNPTVIHPLLFRAASRTLLALAKDTRHLGAFPGITAVLHTWTRDLRYHPHLHCVITGGGLALDGSRWISAPYNGRYLFPIKVISKLFRGKFLAGLAQLYRQQRLDLTGTCEPFADPRYFAALKDALYLEKWVVYAKKPIAGTPHVFAYLGRYTHRVAISNQRIISFDDNGVTFATRNEDHATLTPNEFIRRFLLHVLPTGFVKIRHFGLYASGNVTTKLHAARDLIAARTPSEARSDAAEKLSELIAAFDRERQKSCPICASQMALISIPRRRISWLYELPEPEP